MKKLKISVTFAEFINGKAFTVEGMEKDFVFRLEETANRDLIVSRFLLTSDNTTHHCNVEKLNKIAAECYALTAFNIVVRFKLVFNAQANNTQKRANPL